MGEKVSGVISLDKLSELGYIPPEERLLRGPVAIFECVEEIPCNVCVAACPFKAVMMKRIVDLPRIDFDKCTGCTLCVAQCPGQAIFVVDASKQGGEAYLSLQYDLSDPPKPGDEVTLLSREGTPLGSGRVIKVYRHKRSEAYVVTLAVPRNLMMDVRAFRKSGGE